MVREICVYRTGKKQGTIYGGHPDDVSYLEKLAIYWLC